MVEPKRYDLVLVDLSCCGCSQAAAQAVLVCGIEKVLRTSGGRGTNRETPRLNIDHAGVPVADYGTRVRRSQSQVACEPTLVVELALASPNSSSSGSLEPGLRRRAA